MKKTVQFIMVALFFSLSSSLFGQMFMDGKDTDWADVPVALEAPDNVDGVFPNEVGAAVKDIVDVKEVKATVVGNSLMYSIRLWGGPAWPNNAYQNDHDGTIYDASRGFYKLLLDLDNDAATGWKSTHYEGHFTTLGYLIDQGVGGQEAIGTEVMLEWGARTNDAWQVTNENKDLVRHISYWAADYSEYDGATDLGSDSEILNMDISNPDSANMVSWEGAIKINSTDDDGIKNDSLRSFWAGHGWGNDFIEVGIEMTALQSYWAAKGKNYLQAGSTIGIAGFIETPIDGWAVDMSTRGEVTLPAELPSRSTAMTFDGSDADWADVPVALEAPDNVDGVFPNEVGAAVKDVVDIKEVKAKTDGENIYYLMKMWGGPAWPNNAYQNDHDGTIYDASRGFYKLLLDLDNDVATGWKSTHYEGHFTTLGYLIDQGVGGQEAIGTEVMLEWGARTNDPWQVANENKDLVRHISYWAADYSQYDGATDLGSDSEIFNYDVIKPDSASMAAFDGMLLNNSSDDSTTMDGQADWMAHSWGNDFIEVGMSLRNLKKYWANKGVDIFASGQTIGIAGFIETPIDGWAVDMSTRGQFDVVTGVNDKRNDLVVDGFALGNNYPNPFNPTTSIKFSVGNLAKVSLVVYNSLGQKVKTLIDSKELSGNQTAVWNGKNDFGSIAPSGVYYYRMESGSNTITKSMVLLK